MTTYTVPAGRYGDYSTAFIQAYINEKVASVVDLAPATLDTLNELAAAIGDDPAFFTTMANANAAIQADVDANEAASDAAEAALSARLDTLEADPTTATALAAIGVTASDARTALQTLLQNAIDAVQADVNTNESDADTAIALRATIDNPTFTTKIASPEFHSAGSHLKFKADTNDIIFYPNNTETLQITRHSSTGHPNFTANGGSGEFKFNQVVDLADGLKVGGVAVTSTAAELNFVDGVTSNIQTQIDAVQADVNQNETDADAGIAAANVAMLAAVATVQADVDQNETDADAADTALSNRITTLEADPTTATALAAVQADVDQNETDADAAIAAVQADVDQNETDADAAIAAVQADVDQNESDADAAIALKAPLAAPSFTGDVSFDSGAMFFKQSSGRLGLGTTNPGDSVHVHGGLIVQRSGGSSKIYLKQNTTDDGMTIQGQSNSANCIVLDTVGGSAGVKFTNNDNGTLATIGSTISLNKDVTMKLSSSVTPSANLDMMVEATNNTTLTFKLKGSDGTVRSGTITLS